MTIKEKPIKYISKQKNKIYFRISIPKDITLFLKQTVIKRLLPCETNSCIEKYRNLLLNNTNRMFRFIRANTGKTQMFNIDLIEQYIDTPLQKLNNELNRQKKEELPVSLNNFLNKYDFTIEDMYLINFLYKQHQRAEILHKSIYSNILPDDNMQKTDDIGFSRYKSSKRILATYVHQQNWDRRYRKEVVAGFKLFCYKFTNIRDINNRTLNDFLHNILMKYPKNASKIEKFKNLSIDEQLKTKITIKEKMSIRTIEKYSIWYNNFLKWLYQNEYLPHQYSIKSYKKVKKLSPQEKRKIYSDLDLKKLFQSKIYLNPQIDLTQNYHKLIIPLIAMYSGMRLQEICQLERKDIVKIDGIECFDINDISENNHFKKIKSFAGHRKIPIHSKLYELGIIDFLKNIQEGTLWKNLKADKYGSYNGTYGKQFQKINKRYIVNFDMESKKSFHSFRHTFAYKLKQSNVDTDKISELLGHSKQSVTAIYTKKFIPKVLKKEIEKLSYKIKLPYLKF